MRRTIGPGWLLAARMACQCPGWSCCSRSIHQAGWFQRPAGWPATSANRASLSRIKRRRQALMKAAWRWVLRSCRAASTAWFTTVWGAYCRPGRWGAPSASPVSSGRSRATALWSRASTAASGLRCTSRATSARAQPRWRNTWKVSACTPGRKAALTWGSTSLSERPCSTASTQSAVWCSCVARLGASRGALRWSEVVDGELEVGWLTWASMLGCAECGANSLPPTVTGSNQGPPRVVGGVAGVRGWRLAGQRGLIVAGQRQRAHGAAIDAVDALLQRGVRIEPVGHSAGLVGHQQHVLHHGAHTPRHHAFALLAHDLAQHAAQTVAAAGPLHRAGVGQVFALARHRGLQRVTGEPTQPARDHDGQADQGQGHAAVFFVRFHQLLPHAVQHFQPEHHADEPHVEPGIAFADVAEPVRHQALKLLTREVFQRTAGGGHHAALLVPP